MRPRIGLIGLPRRSHNRRLVRRLTSLGYAVTTIDAGHEAYFDDIAETSLHVTRLASREVVDALRAADQGGRLDGVVLYHEMSVVTSTEVAAALGLPHFPLEIIEACADKVAMRSRMRDHGVACPRFAAATGFADARAACAEIGYPVVVKPARGGASYGVTRIDDEVALRTFFENVDIFWEPRRFIVERYLPGHEVSVETVTIDGDQHVHLAVFDKPQLLDGPYFLEEVYVTPGWLDSAGVAAVHAATSDLIRKFPLSRCITHTELRLTQRGPIVVEFGLRPIGWPGPLCVEATTGVDMVAIMAALACGRLTELPRPSPRFAAGWQYLVIREPGVIRHAPSEASLDGDGILDASVWVNEGDRVDVPPREFDYIRGHLAVAAANSDGVRDRLRDSGLELRMR